MKDLFSDVKKVISDLFFTLALYNANLLGLIFLYFGLNKRLPEESCDVFVVVSTFDLAVGDRYFYFCMAGIWNQILYFLDQPALQFSKLITLSVAALTNLDSGQSSWLFAILILIISTLQWLAVGSIIDGFRRRRCLRKHAFCVSQNPANQLI